MSSTFTPTAADAVIVVVDATKEQWENQESHDESSLLSFHAFLESLILFVRSLLALSHSRPVAVLAYNGIQSEIIVPRPPGYLGNGTLDPSMNTKSNSQHDTDTPQGSANHDRSSGASNYPSATEIAAAMHSGLHAMYSKGINQSKDECIYMYVIYSYSYLLQSLLESSSTRSPWIPKQEQSLDQRSC